MKKKIILMQIKKTSFFYIEKIITVLTNYNNVLVYLTLFYIFWKG